MKVVFVREISYRVTRGSGDTRVCKHAGTPSLRTAPPVSETGYLELELILVSVRCGSDRAKPPVLQLRAPKSLDSRDRFDPVLRLAPFVFAFWGSRLKLRGLRRLPENGFLGGNVDSLCTGVNNSHGLGIQTKITNDPKIKEDIPTILGRCPDDLRKISRRSLEDIPKILGRYPDDLVKISRRSQEDIPTILGRYPDDLRKISRRS